MWLKLTLHTFPDAEGLSISAKRTRGRRRVRHEISLAAEPEFQGTMTSLGLGTCHFAVPASISCREGA